MSNEANGGGMSRAEALEAVAEAAERVVRLGFVQSDGALAQSVAALRALDALPAALEPARGEVVEVQAHIRLSTDGGAYIISGMGALDGRWIEPRPGVAFATITARVPLPTIPTIEGSCLPLVKRIVA